MKHSYYISEDLGEMEAAHDDLVHTGLKDKNIHVLSDDDANVVSHHLRSVNPFAKTDIVRSGTYGAFIGITLAGLVLAIPQIWAINSPVGNVPFVFGAIVLFGFSIWEGGLLGIHQANKKYALVDDQIHHGQHLMIVDYENSEGSMVEHTMRTHPKLKPVTL